MKLRILLFFILNFILVIQFNLKAQPHINLRFEKRSINSMTNTWKFRLVADVLASYLSNNNWSTMNIRTNIVVPSGVTITQYPAGTNLHPSVTSADAQNGFGGGTEPNTIKYALALDRASDSWPDLIPGTTDTLATFTVTFSGAILPTDLVTIRPFGGSAQSFWTRLGDPTPLPFGTPAAFPLPIKLLSFTANKATETSVNLNWTTSSEQNSDYYGVERSQDGVNWTEIGIVDAVGNSDTKMYYDFNDNELPANNRTFHHQLYYKLRLVDQDGKFAYSDVRVVQLDNKNTNHTFNIYPNPSLKFFNINLSGISSEYGDIQMRIFDTMGKLVLEKKMLGGGIELLDMQDYPTGIYLVKIIQGSKQFESRISKI